MRFLDAHETKAALPYPALRDALIETFRAAARGSCQCPPRTHIPLGEGGELMLLMAATDAELAVTKVVTIHPANVSPTPTIQSDVVVTRAVDGQRLLHCNGDVVTERRTSAVSAAALTLLLPPGASSPLHVVVVGGGVQANAHKEAIADCFQQRGTEFRMFSRKNKNSSGAAAYDVDPKDLLWADVIITATASAQPVLSEEACSVIRAGTVVCAVGAFTPSMAELPPKFVNRCRIFADTIEGCQSEAGDLIQAGVSFENVSSIGSVAASEAPQDAGQPLLFKSVGSALWELAAAHCMSRQLQGPSS